MPSALPSVRVRVPAKINLHLAVGPRRKDGYHDVTTVLQALSLYDEVVARPSVRLEVKVTGPDAALVPTDRTNLAWKAAVLLAAHANVGPTVRLEIAKAIPVAGGMAGGSADAAAALIACAELWQTGTSRPELMEIAAELGSDVPFCLSGGTALGTGRGERITPVLAKGRFHWVLAAAEGGISARDAYEELDRQRDARRYIRPLRPADDVLDALRSGDAVRLAATIGNDLEPAAVALRPQLRRTLDAGRELGALSGIVSGSGPTCAFLTTGPAAAARLAAALTAEGVCRSARVAVGPVPGARVA